MLVVVHLIFSVTAKPFRNAFNTNGINGKSGSTSEVGTCDAYVRVKENVNIGQSGLPVNVIRQLIKCTRNNSPTFLRLHGNGVDTECVAEVLTAVGVRYLQSSSQYLMYELDKFSSAASYA